MRVARIATWAAAATLTACLVGCGARYTVTANGEETVRVSIGEKVHVALSQRGSGCGGASEPVGGAQDWMIAPQAGASIKNGMFIATDPGVYKVTAPRPDNRDEYAQAAVITVTGKQITSGEIDSASSLETEPAKPEPSAEESADNVSVKAQEDKPEAPEAKPLSVNTEPARQAKASAIELVFAVANNHRTQGGGQPARFTLKKARRIRMIESYHFVYGGAAPEAGYFTIETKEGTVLGPFITTRVVDGRTGLKNAYWFADVDFVLPPGTYTLSDSDPQTWSQNSRTGGVGFCGISALKQ